MYNFSKTSHDANWREFKQPLFRRGKRSLLSLITRKTQQKSQNDKTSVDLVSEKNSKHERNGYHTSKLSVESSNSNPSNGDLIALIFELQNKISHMENRIIVLERHLLDCPNYNGEEQEEYNISPTSFNTSIQSFVSPAKTFTFQEQSFRDPSALSVPSTRQNSENGSMCSELGSLLSTRSRSSTLNDKVGEISALSDWFQYPFEGIKKEKALHSFDGTYGTSTPNTNRLEGVALQRRNRSISIGYDAFEAAPQSVESGVDAILTAAAAVAQSITTSPPDNQPMNGRPLKKYVITLVLL